MDNNLCYQNFKVKKKPVESKITFSARTIKKILFSPYALRVEKNQKYLYLVRAKIIELFKLFL